MLFELIAVILVGVALAGVAMALRAISRQRLPKWIVPALAGLGMLSYAIWSEYTWYSRVTAQLPPEIVVAWHNGETNFWRPWSYVKPVITRFSAVDRRSQQRNENFPDQVMTDVLLVARWQQSARIKVIFDCVGHRRADLVGRDVKVAENGEVIGANWVALSADDPVLIAACKQG